MYRPSVEILQAFLNPSYLQLLNFINIIDFQPISDCTFAIECDLIRARIEYPSTDIQLSILYVEGVSPLATLQVYDI
jgi:hypothetical protein